MPSPCRPLGASAGSTLAPSLLKLPLTSRSRRPDSSSHARFLGGADLLQFRSGSDRDTHDSFVVAARIVLLEDQSLVELRFGQCQGIEKSLNEVITIHEPRNSRARQQTLAGDHVPISNVLSTSTSCHFFSQLRAAFRGAERDIKSSPIM